MGQTQQTQWKYLERDPHSSLRQLSIKGRRIRARTLYGLFMNTEEPRTIEEIAADYNLPVEVVEEAIAYCRTDPPEIRLDHEIEEALIEAHGMNDPNYKDDPKGKYRMLSPQERHRIIDEVVRRFRNP
jgi:uncharacterized protein (DUF433 family)